MRKSVWVRVLICAFCVTAAVFGLVWQAKAGDNAGAEYREGDSYYRLYESVRDLSETEWTFEDGALLLPADEAKGLEEGSLIFSRKPIQGDVAMGYRVTGIQQRDGMTVLTLEETDGTEIFAEYHVEMNHEQLKIASIRSPGDRGNGTGSLFNSDILGNSEDRTVSFDIKIDDNLSVSAKVTLSMYMDAEYDGRGLPTGYGILTKEVHLVSTVKFKDNPITGKLASYLGSVLDDSYWQQTKVRPLEVTLANLGFFRVTGSVKFNITFALVGNCDITFVKKTGVYLDGLTYRTVDDPMKYIKTNDKAFDIAGSLSVGFDLSVGLKATGFRDILAITGGVTAKIETKLQPQFDDNIICYDIPITYDINLGLKFQIGIGTEHVGYSFIEKKINLFKVNGTLFQFHMELSRDEGHLLFTHLNFMKECSIPEDTKLTFKFVTGTREGYNPKYAVFGQSISAPKDPIPPNERIRFLYWSLDREGTKRFEFDTPITREALEGISGTVKLYAFWSEPYRKVTIDYNAEGYEPIVEWQIAGTRLMQPTVPMRMNYRFAGYQYIYKDAAGNPVSGDWSFDENLVPEADITITGKWTYEEGYNPVSETVQTIRDDMEENEERLAHYYDGLYFTKTMSTAVQAQLSPVHDEALDILGIGTIHITGYTGNEPVMIIPYMMEARPVVSLDGSGFTNKDSLVGLVIPSTVLYVTGFQDCPNLQFVIFEDAPTESFSKYHGTRRIGRYAFANCPKLEMIQFPANLTWVDNYAFANTGVITLDMPASVERWNNFAFASCKNLTTVTLPEGYANSRHVLDHGIFSDCEKLVTVHGLEQIYGFDEKCLYNTGLTSLDLKNIAAMGGDAFSGCKHLKTLKLDFSTGYSSNVFGGGDGFCNLPELEEVETWGTGLYSFSGFPKLKKLTVHQKWNDENVFDYLPVYNLPVLEEAIIDADIVGQISVYNCPELRSLYTRRLLRDDGALCDTLSITDCPKLSYWHFEGTTSENTRIWIRNTGLEYLDLSMFRFISMATITGNDNLKEVIFPDGISMPNLTMKDNRLMLDLNWLSESIFVIPDYWEDLERLRTDGISGEPKLRRLVFTSDLEVTNNTQIGDAFVFVCQQGSQAYSWFTAKAQEGWWYPYQVLTPDDPRTQKRAVVFKSRQQATLLLDGCEDSSTEWEAVSYQTPGEKLRYPDCLFRDSGWALEGWYFDSAYTQRVPDGMTVTDDMILYAHCVRQEADFDWRLSNSSVVITGYHGDGERISVPAFINGMPVTAIEEKAFSGSSAVSVSLPESIEELSSATFDGMDSLANVLIMNDRYESVNGIVYARDAQGNPAELVCLPTAKEGSASIAEGITEIKPEATRKLSRLEEVSFPESVETIQAGAFSECASLETVIFASDVDVADGTFICEQPIRFRGPLDAPMLCAWADRKDLSYNEYSIYFDTSVRNAPETLRAGTPLDEYQPEVQGGRLFIGWSLNAGAEEPELVTVMPEADIALQAVWKELFSGEDGVLTRIDPAAAPDAVICGEWTAIAAEAADFDLDSIYIPAGITQIDEGAFTGTVGKIIGHTGTAAEAFAVQQGILFEEKTYTLYFATEWRADPEPITGSLGQAIELPQPQREGMEFTGWYEDYERTVRFEAETMPGRDILLYAGWKKIPGYQMEFLCRFEDDDTVTILGYTGDDPMPVFPETVDGLPVTAIAPYAFSGNETLYDLVIPACVEEIGVCAFSNSCIARITVEGSDCVIGEGCFAGCACLTQAVLPDGMTAVPARLFSGCGFEEITLPDTVAVIGDNAFDGCEELETLNLPAALEDFSPACLGDTQPNAVIVPAQNTNLSGNGTTVLTADGTKLLYVCRNVTVLTVPAGVTEIAEEACSDCWKLHSVELPDGLEKIGSYAFAGCRRLTEIRLPSSVTTIGENIFGNNTDIAIYVNSLNDPVVSALREQYTVIAAEQAVPVETISLTAPETMALHATAQAAVTILPAGATDTRVEYYTDHPEILRVSDDGLITATALGEANLIVRAANGITAVQPVRVELNGSASLTLKVENALYTETDGTVGINEGTLYVLRAEELAGQTVSATDLSTDDETIVISVSSGGFRIHMIKESGLNNSKREFDLTAEYTLQNGSVGSGTIHLCVNAVRETELPKTLTLFEGDSWTYTGPAPSEESGWDSLVSSNPTVVRTEGSTIHALQAGRAVVRYPFAAGETMVTVKQKECDLTATLANNLAFKNYTVQINTVCSDPECDIVYESGNESTVTVDSQGVVTGVSTGSAEITVSAVKDGAVLNRRILQVTCITAYSKINLEGVFQKDWTSGRRVITLGQQRNLFSNVGFVYADERSVVFTSSDPDIISIDDEGHAYANGVGTAVITSVCLASGTTETVEVISDIWSAQIEAVPEHMTIKAGETRQIGIIRETWDESLSLRYSIDESDAEYLTVDSDGRITGLKAGYSCYVTVEAVNSSGFRVTSATVGVYVTSSNYAEEILDFPQAVSVRRGETVTVFTQDSLNPEGSMIDAYNITILDQTVAGIQTGYYSSVSSLMVKGMNVGETDLCVTLYNGERYLCHVTVTEPELWAEIGSVPSLLVQGDKVTLSADHVVCPHDYALSWSASGSAVSVSASGQVTANSAGSGKVTLTITDRTTGAKHTDSCTIKVEPLLSGFKTPATTVMTRSESGWYWGWYLVLEKKNSSDSEQNLYNRTTVISSNDNITLNYGNLDGEWTGNKLYLFCATSLSRPETITLRTDNGPARAAATQQMTLQMDPNSDSLYLSVPTLYPGQKIDLYECASWSGLGMSTAWQTGDQSVATVTSAGILQAVGTGSTTVTGSYYSPLKQKTITGSTTVNVSGEQITQITADQEELTVFVNGSEGIYISVMPSYAGWSVEVADKTLATLSGRNYCTVFGEKEGDTVILIRGASGGVEKRIPLHVRKALDEIEWSLGDALTLDVGDQYAIQTVCNPAELAEFASWRIADPTVATVSDTGVITGLKPGETSIELLFNGSSREKAVIRVVRTTADLTVQPESLTIRRDEIAALKVFDKEGSELDPATLQFTSSNRNIVTVSAAGVVTGRGRGEAVITATNRTNGQFGRIRITVSGQLTVMKVLPTILVIEEEAFAGNTAVEAVETNASRIDASAFDGCANLKFAVIRNGNAEVDETAFDNCADGFFVCCPKDSAVWQQAELYGWNPVPLE